MGTAPRRDSEPREPEAPGIGVRLAEFSIHHPVTVCMVFTCFVVLGAISMFKIPLVMMPDVTSPFVQVYVPYPNSTPAQTQEAIIKPLEEVLATVPSVERLSSRAEEDSATIGLTFGWAIDADWMRAEVRDKVDQVRGNLPADIERIIVRNYSTTDVPIIEGRVQSNQDLRTAYDFLETKIKNRLERLPGVAEVEIQGAERKEVDIYLRLDDVKRYDVDIGALFRGLDSANLNTSLGRVEHDGQRYSAVARGAMSSLESIRDFPVNRTGLRLREIADIRFDSPPSSGGRHLNGEYSVGFSVRKTSSANTVQTVREVKAAIAELNADPSMQETRLSIWSNQGDEIMKSLTGLLEAGTIGALLAVFVLFLFLRRLDATLVIGFAIPFSIIATVGFLYLAGRTLNVLSMMGLMLSTGMLVDNAVVVLESIFRRLEGGQSRIEAARVGTREVVTAVLAATLTSIIIFVPLVFGKDTELTVYLGDLGVSIIIALLCSLFISLTLIPLAVVRLIDFGGAPRSSRMNRLLDRLPRPRRNVTNRYIGLMGWTLRHRFLVGFIFVPVILAVSFQQLQRIPDNTPEAEDLDDLNIQYEFTENYNYAKIEEQFINPVEAYLAENKQQLKIKDVYSSYGNNEARTRIYFDKDNITLRELAGIRRRISENLPVIPGANIGLGSQSGADSSQSITVNLLGDDPETLSALAQEARRQLLRRDDFSEVITDLDTAREEVQVRLNASLARKYNISPDSVSGLLGVAVRGRKVRGFRTPDGEVDIWVRLQASDRENLGDLRSIVVGTGPDGEEIQLAQVADFDLVKTPSVIRRENRRTYTYLTAVYMGQMMQEGRTVVEEVLNGLNYPEGYGWGYGFWMQREIAEFDEFYFNIYLALFLVYFIMASLFESISHPFAIILSLPFALVGVAWMLTLSGTPFNLMAKIGLLVLLGIVVNNGIVLLDHVNNLRREGKPRGEAILVSCQERLRPILMTACTTIVGLAPLALGKSSLFDMRYFPLARTVMGGLISSTFLTLLVLPVYYTIFDDLANWMKRIWLGSTTPSEPGPQTESASEPATGT